MRVFVASLLNFIGGTVASYVALMIGYSVYADLFNGHDQDGGGAMAMGLVIAPVAALFAGSSPPLSVARERRRALIAAIRRGPDPSPSHDRQERQRPAVSWRGRGLFMRRLVVSATALRLLPLSGTPSARIVVLS